MLRRVRAGWRCVSISLALWIDILDETVQVDVFHYDSSVYIPPNPVLASELPFCGYWLLNYTCYLIPFCSS